MKKTNKILTNVLLGALTLSSLGLANVQAEEGVSDPSTNAFTDAFVTIDDGKIEHTNNTTALTFTVPGFSFETFFGNSPLTTPAAVGNKVELKVDDQRSLNGITDGWKLTASLSKFTRVDNENKPENGETLGVGTYISLKNGDLTSNPTYGNPPKVFSNEIKLFAKETSTLIWSANREDEKEKYLSPVGVDKWTLNYPTANIELTIPNDELVGGSHSAFITWTFSPFFSETSAE